MCGIPKKACHRLQKGYIATGRLGSYSIFNGMKYDAGMIVKAVVIE